MRETAPSITVIEPKTGWVPVDFREIWNYRELLYFLTKRDIKVRYKQTVRGGLWAVIQPAFTMLVFTLFFGRHEKMPSDGVPYPIFVYAGLLPWTYFANAVSSSGNSLVGSSNLITKVYFPRLVVPVSAALAGLIDFFIALFVLAALMIWYQFLPGPAILLFPFLVALTFLCAVGVGLWLSALNVQYRDIRYAIPFLIQVWMFVSPEVMRLIRPGNGESVRFRNLYLHHETERYGTAAYEFLAARPEIDAKRIGVMAISLGGYYAPRAAAFEPRFAACIAWGAQWDYWQIWKNRFDKLDSGNVPSLSVPWPHLLWIFNVATREEAMKKLEGFRLDGVGKKIRCPFLMVHGEGDEQIPLAVARQCFDAVGSKQKTFRLFTREEGEAITTARSTNPTV